MKLYGLMITRDDHAIFDDWCREQLALYDAVVCLDGSPTDDTARIAGRYADRLVYLHERDFNLPRKTDHGLRRVVHQEIVRRFGAGHWVMCCHADEFCHHNPRRIAVKAEAEGYDAVAWYSLHFLPHPDDLADWERLRRLPVPQRIRHYHWGHRGSGLPWVEQRLYRDGPRVAWDDHTHGSTAPHGLERPAPFRPILRHYKVFDTDLKAYECGGPSSYFVGHWPGLEHRTGVAFPVGKPEDLFVASYPGYDHCDRFDGRFPQAWNMGDEYRPGPSAGVAPMSKRGKKQRKPPRRNGRSGERRRGLLQAYEQACEVAVAGDYERARSLYERLQSAAGDARLRALVRNDLAALDGQVGDLTAATEGFREALTLDERCETARANLALLEAHREPTHKDMQAPAESPSRGKIAIVSFLFNWPSTGGGIVHTFELAAFLAKAGFTVRHFYARYPAWDIGRVDRPLPFASEALEFDQASWNVPAIQQRFRRAVADFRPDHVIITDSWNIKPILADAVRDFPYVLRFQAMECLCPLNNLRLLPADGGGFRQCTRHQLANPDVCVQCLVQRGKYSGSLHQAERALSGVGSAEYHQLLLRTLSDAEAVLVVNPLHEAMLSPYSERVRVVTAGMDPARFPWPAPAEYRARPSGKAVLFFAGLVQEAIKGFDVLHAACRRLWQGRQDFELVATGDPAGPVDAFTRFVGWQTQEDLPRHLWSADVLVMPTVAQEALGRTAVEAMAAGLPVVASRIGGLPFTVADGATGLLCEPGNSDALAKAIQTLLDDPDLRRRLGEAGRRRFEEHYSWDVIIQRHYLPMLARA